MCKVAMQCQVYYLFSAGSVLFGSQLCMIYAKEFSLLPSPLEEAMSEPTTRDSNMFLHKNTKIVTVSA